MVHKKRKMRLKTELMLHKQKKGVKPQENGPEKRKNGPQKKKDASQNGIDAPQTGKRSKTPDEWSTKEK
ncbi:hypothetical protein ACQKCU_09060 [Heyndrickxia sporothermodurans]